MPRSFLIDREPKLNVSLPFLKPLCAALIASGSSLLIATPVSAFEFDLGSGIEGSMEVTASYSAGWRTEDPDKEILSDPNGDDGDRAFGDSGTMTTNLVKVVYDLSLKKSVGDDSTIGFFNRGIGFYDDRIKNASNDHDSPFTLNANAIYGGSLTDPQSFTRATQDRAGAEARWLDAYAYFNGNQSDTNAYSIRVGAQVVNWGESAFIQSGITNAINPADVTQANLPGTEVKEILLPQQALYGTYSLSDTLSVEAYYQWQWDHTIAPPVGTFLSTNDLIAEDGAENAFVGPGVFFSRGADVDPSDGGQYGLALRWYAEALNDTEFGLYYVNYHSKLPNLAIRGTPKVLVPGVGIVPPSRQPNPGVEPGTYHIKYFEDINLIGLSFNTVLFDIAFSGEIAYHQDFPLQTVQLAPPAVGGSAMLGGGLFDFSTQEDIFVAQVTVNHSFNTTPVIRRLADDIGFLVEVGVVNAPDLGRGDVFRASTPVDSTAWGYKSQLTLTYFNQLGEWIPAISGTDLIVGLIFNQDVNGTSVIPAGSFTDNAKSAAISLKGSWQTELEVDLRYNWFFGNKESGLTDRDNLSVNFKYRF